MCCNPFLDVQTRKDGKRMKALRAIAFVVCVLYITMSFLSFAFIWTHENHDHDHDGPDGACATCMHVVAAQNLLKTISTLAFTLGIALSLRLIISALCRYWYTLAGVPLVIRKVRMNN
ncbi:MAG: hypothetical protein LBT32_02345 [Peptococcaceae bacterium]|jgi:hypothetical protein|nr:hypothetical protein [Peptococcaceae bacterium]